jgi:hypothetical protein
MDESVVLLHSGAACLPTMGKDRACFVYLGEHIGFFMEPC